MPNSFRSRAVSWIRKLCDLGVLRLISNKVLFFIIDEKVRLNEMTEEDLMLLSHKKHFGDLMVHNYEKFRYTRNIEFLKKPAGTTNVSSRDAWLKGTLEALPAGLRILDAGAGELKYKKHCAHLRYVSQDFCQYDGVGNKEALQPGAWDTAKIDIVSDITNIPVEDESFDVVLCTEVFEHLPEPVKALKEFARILRPGGRLILTAPFCSLTHFSPHFYYTGFSLNFFKTHFAALNIDIIEKKSNGGFFDFLAQELRRAPDIASRYSTAYNRTNLPKLNSTTGELIDLLDVLRQSDTGSSELLTYGIHIVGEKRKP